MSLYIALEGIDGSGKSTLAAALGERLGAEGVEVVVVREPGGTPVGEAVRGLVLDSESLNDWTEVFLFAAQRAELVHDVVGPALDAGKWVVSDRSYYSSIAYQGRARGLGEDRVRALNEMGLGGVIPDKVFVIDVDPSAGLGRQHRQDRISKESADFQGEARAAYLDMATADPERVVVLDGAMTVDQLVEAIIRETG